MAPGNASCEVRGDRRDGAAGHPDAHGRRERGGLARDEVAVRPVEDRLGHPAGPVGVEVTAVGPQRGDTTHRQSTQPEHHADAAVAQAGDRVVHHLDRPSGGADRPERAVGDALVQLVDPRRAAPQARSGELWRRR